MHPVRVFLLQATENAGLKASLEEEQRQQKVYSEEINRLKVKENESEYY